LVADGGSMHIRLPRRKPNLMTKLANLIANLTNQQTNLKGPPDAE
jgi:hypothetical protein